MEMQTGEYMLVSKYKLLVEWMTSSHTVEMEDWEKC
jgi:hypothetical protein